VNRHALAELLLIVLFAVPTWLLIDGHQIQTPIGPALSPSRPAVRPTVSV
jgi:hypothetical protein